MVMEGETIVYRLSLPPVVHPWNCIFSHCLIQSLILAGTKRRIVTSRTEYFFNNLSGSRKSAGVRLAEDGIVTYAKIKVCVWARIYRFISLPQVFQKSKSRKQPTFFTCVFTRFTVLSHCQLMGFLFGKLNGQDSSSLGSMN
jgi:hypothetical protein